MLQFNPDWAHVAALALANFFLGWAWYSPLLFGNVWMRALGIVRPKTMTPAMKKEMLLLMGSAAVSAFLMSLGALVLVQSLGATTAGQGVAIGVTLVGLLVVPHAAGSLFEGRKVLVFGLGGLHAFAVIGMDCAIHAAWR